MTTSKKKILFVGSSLGSGGAEKILIYLINNLDPGKYDMRLVLLQRTMDYVKELEHPIRIDYFDKTSRLSFIKIILQLRRLLREYRPDAVISLLNFINIVAVLSKLLSGIKTRTIICEHLHLLNYYRSFWGRIKKVLAAFIFGKADDIVVVAADMKAHMEKEFGLPPAKVKVIYNPIPLEKILEKSREEVDHPFFRAKQLQVIITAGRLVRQKRYDRLIRAFAQAKAKEPNLRLLILGRGELEQELKSLAAELRVRDDIDFLGFKENPYAWIAKARAFALSSEREGFPNVLIEAMVCGVPVISTDCLSGPREIIETSHSGLLVPEEDLHQLAEALADIVRDDARRRRFVEAGKRYAANFRVDKVIPQYEALVD